MDLIYTNAKLIDQGVLQAYGFDLSFGADENDFEMTLGVDVLQGASQGGQATAAEAAICGIAVCGLSVCGVTVIESTTTEITVTSGPSLIDYGAAIYIEGTEYGGIVDAVKATTHGNTITYIGRTWHGCLNSKVITPDDGENYYVVSGDANEILADLIARLTLSDLFVADETASGINISRYQFHRYCKGYDGIRDMLADNGAKLKIVWEDRTVKLSAVPVDDYTDSPIDGDIATLSVEHHDKAVNHLICLGSGELADREVLHLYVDQNGKIGKTQYYTGLDEYSDTYDYSNAESSADLEKSGIKRLKELRDADEADISIIESDGITYDVGDIVGAKEQRTGISVTATVTQKIVKINNGAIRTEYKTGG